MQKYIDRTRTDINNKYREHNVVTANRLEKFVGWIGQMIGINSKLAHDPLIVFKHTEFGHFINFSFKFDKHTITDLWFDF